MTRLTFPLVGGAALVVERPAPAMLGGATEVSFYAASGDLDPALRDALDAAIPMTFGGPDAALDRIVRATIGTMLDDRPVNAPMPHRGESTMESLQRVVDDDRATNDNH